MALQKIAHCLDRILLGLNSNRKQEGLALAVHLAEDTEKAIKAA